MAHPNQILPFAVGTGANVEDPALWASDTARLTGFQAGLANSTRVNTAIRQAAFAAAMVAQFTADYGPAAVNDDGNVATFESNFVAALGAALSALTGRGVYWGLDTGPANALHVVTTPALPSYSAGTTVITIPAHDNTGPSTLQIGTLGVLALENSDGSPLVAGDIKAGRLTIAVHDGSVFRLYGLSVSSGSLIHRGDDTGGANSIVVTVTPAITSYDRGAVYAIKVLNRNTGATVANINGLGNRPVVRFDGSALAAGDMLAGRELLLVDDGANLQFVGFAQSQVQQTFPNPVLWVRTDGNDSNDGLANSSTRAFGSIGAAIQAGISKYNLAGTSLTIRLGLAGTYASPGNIPQSVGPLIIQGDAAAQGSYIVSGPGFSGGAALAATNATVTFTGLTIQQTGAIDNNHVLGCVSSSVSIDHVTLANVGTAKTFGAHLFAGSSSVSIGAGVIVAGSMGMGIYVNGFGSVLLGPTAAITGSGSITYAIATADAEGGNITALSGSSFSATVTGLRYSASLNGTINVGGGGFNFFPGTIAGTTSSGGQYAP